ncbi:Serine/threonine-protein kinase stt7 [Chlorella vulgaris]
MEACASRPAQAAQQPSRQRSHDTARRPLLPPPPQRQRRQRQAVQPSGALLPEHLDAFTSGVHHLLTLAYEPIVLPCSSMNCGDMTYRSTLDPVLRMEEKGINPQGLALLAAAAFYLTRRPGVLSGFFDTYFQAPMQARAAKVYCKEDFDMGKKLATGGFGTVYKATLEEDGRAKPVIVKKATEFGEAEAWMNERMMRVAPKAAAQFITAFSDGKGAVGDSTWLVWDYEGDFTLADLMQKKEFPYNLEQALFGRELNIPKGPERKAAIIRVALQQLVQCLEKAHGVGIVHRDIKPQNCILSERDSCIKLIDFGAAADLRIGLNYVPNQYLLDPRYAPPQQYIMSKLTPRAPPAPVAALLSPVLWQLNAPDRFDMYSVGVVLLQMAFPLLRGDNTLITFNKLLAEQYGWNLAAWRQALERRGDKAYSEGFAVLDADGGAGWELLCSLIQYDPSKRLSAAQTLRHPWFGVGLPMKALSSTVASLGKAAGSVLESVDDDWLQRRVSRNGTRESGGFTEAYLSEEGLTADSRKRGDDDLPESVANSSSTIAWWQSRQAEVEARLILRRVKAGKVAKPVGEIPANGNGNVNGNAKKAVGKLRLFDMVGGKGNK